MHKRRNGAALLVAVLFASLLSCSRGSDGVLAGRGPGGGGGPLPAPLAKRYAIDGVVNLSAFP